VLGIALAIATLISALALDGGASRGLEQPHAVTRNLRAFAALFLWVRLLRVFLVFPRYGPYVLMIFTMSDDVMKFLIVFAANVLAFSAAFFALYEPAPADRTLHWLDMSTSEVCTEQMHSYLKTILFLFENSLSGGDLEFFYCIRNSESNGSGWILALLFHIIAVILLLNMLIAMMAKSFDNVSESSVPNYLFLKAQLVYSTQAMADVPPVLYALSLPYWICTTAWNVPCLGELKISRAISSRRWRGRKPEKRGGRMQRKSIIDRPDATAAMLTRKLSSQDKSLRELAEMIARYVKDHDDDISPEEHWRSAMSKRLSGRIAQLEDRQHEQVERLQTQLTEIAERSHRQESMLIALSKCHGLSLDATPGSTPQSQLDREDSTVSEPESSMMWPARLWRMF